MAKGRPGPMTQVLNALVVDASVAAKWHLRDEQDASRSWELLQAFLNGELALIAPSHIRYEVPSSITAATLHTPARLTFTQAQAAISDFLDLNLPTVDDAALLAAAFPLTHQLRIAFYDAVYLALSQQSGLPFITADNRLYRRIRHLPNVLWLAAWSSAH